MSPHWHLCTPSLWVPAKDIESLCLIAVSICLVTGRAFPQRFFVSSCSGLGAGPTFPMELRHLPGYRPIGPSPKGAAWVLPLDPSPSSWDRSLTDAAYSALLRPLGRSCRLVGTRSK